MSEPQEQPKIPVKPVRKRGRGRPPKNSYIQPKKLTSLMISPAEEETDDPVTLDSLSNQSTEEKPPVEHSPAQQQKDDEKQKDDMSQELPLTLIEKLNNQNYPAGTVINYNFHFHIHQ